MGLPACLLGMFSQGRGWSGGLARHMLAFFHSSAVQELAPCHGNPHLRPASIRRVQLVPRVPQREGRRRQVSERDRERSGQKPNQKQTNKKLGKKKKKEEKYSKKKKKSGVRNVKKADRQKWICVEKRKSGEQRSRGKEKEYIRQVNGIKMHQG